MRHCGVTDTGPRLDTALGAQFTCRQVPRLEGTRDKRPNLAIYAGMQGESEFTFGGTLKGWRIVERNAAIGVPTLVLAGEYDTMSVEQHAQSAPLAVPQLAPCASSGRASRLWAAWYSQSEAPPLGPATASGAQASCLQSRPFHCV